jgi:hypothetical protein
MEFFNVDYSQDIMLELKMFLNKLNIDNDEKKIILQSIIPTQLKKFDDQMNQVIIPDRWAEKLLMYRSDDIYNLCSGIEHNNCDYTRDITTNTTLTKKEEYSKHFCENILTHGKVFKVESDKISMLDLQNNSTKNYSIELEEDYMWVRFYDSQVKMYGYLLIKSLMICESAWRIINNDNSDDNSDDDSDDVNSDYGYSDNDDSDDDNSNDCWYHNRQ